MVEDVRARVQNFGERAAGTPVSALFLSRWSPRAMTGEPIPDEILFALLEAARFAPSSLNAQPWRMVYARKGEKKFDELLAAMVPVNQAWARNASALIVIASKAEFFLSSKPDPIQLPSASFDAGAAWASLAFQAEILGWSLRAIGGFDRDRARLATGASEKLKLEAIIAVGRRGAPELAPEERRALEKPNQRRPLDEIAFAGAFPAEA